MATRTFNQVFSSSAFLLQKVSGNSTLQLASGATGYIEADIAKTGYTPIALCGFIKSGTNTNYCLFYEFWIEDGTLGLYGSPIARAYFRNVGSAAASISCQFIVAYVKNS